MLYCIVKHALKANRELSKVGMPMTKILETLTEPADFLSLESLVYIIRPYGEWNTGIVGFDFCIELIP